MPFVRILTSVVVLSVGAVACSESDMSPGDAPTGLERVSESVDEVLAQLPDVCATLQTDGYETRKVALAEATDTDRARADDACPEELERLAAAQGVEEATAALGDAPTITFDDCAGTRTGFDATVSITNTDSAPIGVYASVRATVEGAPTGVGAAAVVWRLEPGASATRDVSGVGNGDACAVEFNVFLVTPGDGADGSVNAPASPEVAADDPAVWVPALIEAEESWLAEPTVDGPARTEDLRSTAYRRLVDAVHDGTTDPPAVDGVTVCSATANADTPDLVAVEIRLGDTVMAGVARRGGDGGWRWLGTTLVLGVGPCPQP